MEIMNSKKEEMKPLTNKQQKSYQNPKICYINKKIEDKCAKDKKFACN